MTRLTRSAARLLRGLAVALILSSPGVVAAGETAASEEEILQADLLIVGGTESGCAAAVQAARMGVQRIVLVNDIEWLGGQFTAESLAAYDENTDRPGVRHQQPIPRHGLFKEVVDRIEADNLARYGVARPGNTRVITTCRPADAQRVFRNWLEPYVERGQIALRSWYEPVEVIVREGRVVEVKFASRRADRPSLRVQAALTIDASDWGDVIRLSGADYEFGPDLKSKYGEPLAPEAREGYPLTDMNPITYCMVIVETDQYRPITKPPDYDPRNYRTHRWPKDPLWLYGTRRLVDRYHFRQIEHPDVLLLCFPAIDYPLDVLPQAVADALEATEAGASGKNIVQLTPSQRQIIFEDAKRYSLGFLYYLQTEVHEQMADPTHSFRRFRLSDEFGTSDKLPFKPYVRESLRMKAMYMMRQQDTMGVGDDSSNFARAMYHDGVGVWQFEYDFHPTKREFLDDGNPAGPWRCGFRDGRTWGPPYSGRSLLPLRSLVPENLDGLLAAQKNLGFSSIVSAALRLHDHSMAVGQASGAAAAIALRNEVAPRQLPFDRRLLMQVQTALASRLDASPQDASPQDASPQDASPQDAGPLEAGPREPRPENASRPLKGQPAMLWPFRDLEPSDPSFTAVQMLAVQGCLPLHADDVDFRAEQAAEQSWMREVVERTRDQLADEGRDLEPPWKASSRGEFARRWWAVVGSLNWKPYVRLSGSDADGDGIADRDDALPLDHENACLPLSPLAASADGSPDALPDGVTIVRRFNFGGKDTPVVDGFVLSRGQVFSEERGHGWKRDISGNHRRRGVASVLPDTFLFTRSHDTWECVLPPGTYVVELSIGDAAHEQFGQHVTVEGIPLVRDHRTPAGRFRECRAEVKLEDGRLTVEIGLPGSETNTCLNWLRITSPKASM